MSSVLRKPWRVDQIYKSGLGRMSSRATQTPERHGSSECLAARKRRRSLACDTSSNQSSQQGYNGEVSSLALLVVNVDENRPVDNILGQRQRHRQPSSSSSTSSRPSCSMLVVVESRGGVRWNVLTRDVPCNGRERNKGIAKKTHARSPAGP